MKKHIVLKIKLIAFSAIFNLSFLIHNSLNAQNIGINGTGANAHPSALLDIDAIATPSLGILIPRISLQAINVSSPISSPATSLLVYNTATAGTGSLSVVPGYYYWNGTNWVAFTGSGSNDWAILGNAGTVNGTNFIGTTDNVPLNIRVNNQRSGKIDNLLGNAFWGYQAGNANSTGNSNVAIGQNALTANTTGIYNNAVGSNALFSNISGGFNTALGVRALATNNGSNNTAIGVDGLRFNTTGSNNVALGVNSIQNNSTGSNNVALGYSALTAHISGDDNVAIGFNALSSVNNTNQPNIAIGAFAARGGDPTPSNNTMFNNIAIGYQSINGTSSIASTGFGNTAVGNTSLSKNTSGSRNSVLGDAAMSNNTSGSENVGIGSAALSSNISGGWNTAIGSRAMLFNTTANFNTAIGYNSLQLNTTGTSNVAIGAQAMSSNTSGNNNVAMGLSVLLANTIGSNNLAIGYNALASNISGNNNVAVGYQAGATNPIYNNYNNNTFLGYNADVQANNLSNATALGYNAKVGGSNMLVLGGTGADAVNVGIGTTTPAFRLDVNGTTACTGNVWTSDIRKKQNIKPLEFNGLDIIKKLNPVTYEWKDIKDAGMKGIQMGFIAQELEMLLPSMVITSNDDEKSKGVKYIELMPIYAKAIQEQQTQIEELKKEIELLKKK